MTDLDLLQSVLLDEYAAVYAYGVLGARLTGPARERAVAFFDAHRAARDDVLSRLRAAGRTPPGPSPAYEVQVTGQAAALALAVHLEEALAVRWRDVIAGTTDTTLRRLGTSGLTACAVRATTWRRTAGIRPATVALPGIG